jgi:alkyl hydroperoxide reductase subunit AhpC
MKRNGMPALDFHGPALAGGEVTYLHGTHYVNRVVALCFVPYVSFLPAEEVDRQAARLEEVGATLLVVSSGVRSLDRLLLWHPDKPITPVLADLCGRLHRSFGVMAAKRSARCHTFLIDRKGILRLRVTHDFVDRDMKTLCKIVELTDIHKADTEPEHRSQYVPV